MRNWKYENFRKYEKFVQRKTDEKDNTTKMPTKPTTCGKTQLIQKEYCQINGCHKKVQHIFENAKILISETKQTKNSTTCIKYILSLFSGVHLPTTYG